MDFGDKSCMGRALESPLLERFNSYRDVALGDGASWLREWLDSDLGEFFQAKGFCESLWIPVDPRSHAHTHSHALTHTLSAHPAEPEPCRPDQSSFPTAPAPPAASRHGQSGIFNPQDLLGPALPAAKLSQGCGDGVGSHVFTPL